VDPVLPPALAVIPTKVSGTGLGSFTATNPDPVGEILGRRIEAFAVVTVATTDVNALSGAAAAVSAALLADLQALETAGIQKIRLAEMGSRETRSGPGPPAAQMDLRFELTYEFLKIPAAPEDVIADIPIALQIG
jgi:hypothetical protein